MRFRLLCIGITRCHMASSSTKTQHASERTGWPLHQPDACSTNVIPRWQPIQTGIDLSQWDHLTRRQKTIECVHMTSRRPSWRNKQRNGGHVGGVQYSFGDWTLFLWNILLLFHYANMALVTWANTLYISLFVYLTLSNVHVIKMKKTLTKRILCENVLNRGKWYLFEEIVRGKSVCDGSRVIYNFRRHFLQSQLLLKIFGALMS